MVIPYMSDQRLERIESASRYIYKYIYMYMHCVIYLSGSVIDLISF